jgi:hypothetical protein
MASATISNSGGPGSTIQLAPETIRVRDAVIARCENQTLEQMNEFVKSLLANETDELKRLGVLAARVFILRQRIHSLGTEGQVVDAKNLLDGTYVSDVATIAAEAPPEAPAQSGWTRLRILKECEVNDVRFFGGAIVDVRAADAEPLIKSGDAEIQQESKPATSAPATTKSDDAEPPAKASPKAPPAIEDPVPTKTLEASSTPKVSEAAAAFEPAEPTPETAPADAVSSAELDAPFEDKSTPGLSDEERADEAMNAIFAAADKQEVELAEAAARAAAEEEAAAKAAAEAEAAARGIIDDTEEPETDATSAAEDAAPTVPPEAALPEAAADDAPAELDAIEIGVDSSDLEELAAFAGLTGEPTVPGDADDKAK